MSARLQYLNAKHWAYKTFRNKSYKRTLELRKCVSPSGYSLAPLDEKKTIFVHIPKCAGIAVNRSLFSCLGPGHITFDKYTYIFEPSCILDYFKFTIVRNPWDRVVSSYHFLKNGGFGPEDQAFFERELAAFPDFKSFVKRWLNRKSIWKWHHFRPQYHYFLEQFDVIRVDYFGFFENLEEDFAYINERLGTSASLSKRNSSKHRPYADYYDLETKKIVERVYQKDIRLLGYTFNNSNLKYQLKKRNELIEVTGRKKVRSV